VNRRWISWHGGRRRGGRVRVPVGIRPGRGRGSSVLALGWGNQPPCFLCRAPLAPALSRRDILGLRTDGAAQQGSAKRLPASVGADSDAKSTALVMALDGTIFRYHSFTNIGRYATPDLRRSSKQAQTGNALAMRSPAIQSRPSSPR
jgi:hypothetical protein